MTVKLSTDTGDKYFDSEVDCLEFYNEYSNSFEIRKCAEGNELWHKSQNRRVGVFYTAPSVGFF